MSEWMAIKGPKMLPTSVIRRLMKSLEMREKINKKRTKVIQIQGQRRCHNFQHNFAFVCAQDGRHFLQELLSN